MMHIYLYYYQIEASVDLRDYTVDEHFCFPQNKSGRDFFQSGLFQISSWAFYDKAFLVCHVGVT